MRKRLLSSCTLAIGALLFASCRPNSGISIRDQATLDQILLLGNEAEAASLDPHLNTSNSGSKCITTLIEGLIAYHPSDDNLPEPGVAESWEHKDYTLWTFHLRKNARWSNADPVTSQDFVYSYQRILSPELGGNYAEMLHIIKGATAFNRGEDLDFSHVSVKALDTHTLQIELVGPTPYFLNLIKHHAWHPVHPPTIEKYGGMTKPDSTWTRDEYIGNGPYTIKEWTLNKVLKVEKNPLYWDADTVTIQEIHFFPITDISSEDHLFNSGGLHYASTIPSDMIPVYKKNKDPYLRLEPWFASYFFKINVTLPHLSDKRVRRALSMAVNRRAITKRIMKGDQAIALSLTPPGAANYDAPHTLGFNPKHARKLLAEAGYPNGKGFPKMTLLYNTSDQHKAVTEAIQEMWINILGIEVEIRNQEWKTYLQSQDQLDYDISRAGWIGDYPYPDTFLNMFRTGDGNNRTGWGDARYDTLLKESFTETDATRRLEMLCKAESILVEELPVIPLYYYRRIYRIDPAVKGWYPKRLDNRNYKYIRLTPKS